MPSFRKSERLCSKVAIDHLFSVGRPIFKYPVKLIWLADKADNKPALRVVISVSKRKFKRAVDRNRIKRLLRECFRLNKFIIENDLKNRQCSVALIYIGKEVPAKNDLESIIIDLFHRLSKDYENLVG